VTTDISHAEPTGLAPASRGQLRSARRLLTRKERDRRGEFLAEGPQAVREALAQPGTVRQLFATSAAAAAHPKLIAAAQAQGVLPVSLGADEVAAITDTVTPQGVVAVCAQRQPGLAEVLQRQPRLLVGCAAVRDPGNAGTVIRCADAFGADAVVFTAGSVEVTNPKTVRASVGSLFHLPLVTEVELAELAAAARTAGLQVFAADGSEDADELPALSVAGVLTAPTLWLFGNEAWGLSAADRDLADRVVRVPIYGAAESLNLATAAAVCLYASATAQRSNALAPGAAAFLD